MNIQLRPSRRMRKSFRNKQPHSFVTAYMYANGELILHNIDFQAWDYNIKEGTVEALYHFDESNTLKLCQRLKATSTKMLFDALKSYFYKKGEGWLFLGKIIDFCDSHKIKFCKEVYY